MVAVRHPTSDPPRPRRSSLQAAAARKAAGLPGVDRLAGLVRRPPHDDVVVELPPQGKGRRAPARVRMRRHDGQDQIARDVGAGGLWGFEPPLPALFVELARRCGGAVFDVGANTGLYSLLAAGAAPTLRVHAVEPFPTVAKLLDENLGLNRRLARRIRVHRYALSEARGTAALYLPPPSGALIETSASLDPTFKEEVAGSIEVVTRSLDDLWDEVGRPVVGMLKVDTEGTEHLVLRGGRAMLESSRPIVFCEVLPRARTEELTALVRASDWVEVRLHKDAVVLGETVAFDPDGWNHAFVPNEKLRTFRAAALAAALHVRDERTT